MSEDKTFEGNAATTAIATALHAVMSEVSYVQKTGKNAFHNYSYAGEADLLTVLRPVMLRHGLMLLPSVENVSPVDEHGNVTVLMSYSLIHKDGYVWPHPLNAAGMGNDRAKNGSVGDKGVYKAITGANKYLLFKLFQIETGDDPEVTSQHDQASSEPTEANDAPMSKETARGHYDVIAAALNKASTLEALAKAWANHADVIKKLPADWQTHLVEFKEERKSELTAPAKPANTTKVAPSFDHLEAALDAVDPLSERDVM